MCFGVVKPCPPRRSWWVGLEVFCLALYVGFPLNRQQQIYRIRTRSLTISAARKGENLVATMSAHAFSMLC